MQKILIIEDDGDIAAIERDYLELNNFHVEIAPDGITGLERGLHGAFDLILLDLMLPGMDGFSVCRRLREETDIPILMVTARREDIDKIRGLGLLSATSSCGSEYMNIIMLLEKNVNLSDMYQKFFIQKVYMPSRQFCQP